MYNFPHSGNSEKVFGWFSVKFPCQNHVKLVKNLISMGLDFLVIKSGKGLKKVLKLVGSEGWEP
jgi:hypothetical protein